MKLNTDVTSLMGLPVEYCRAKADEKGASELHRGKGVIVGVIVGASRRIQVMVKDDSSDKNSAFTLDPVCINPSNADADAYFSHHQKIKAIVEEHNAAQRTREAEKIKEVDDINAKMFGPPLEI